MVTRFEEQSKQAMEAMQANQELARGYHYHVEASVKHDTFNRLNRIKAPTLVISGKYDGSIPQAVAEKMAEKIPSADLELIDHGHTSWYFDPAVWQKIIDFLK